MTHASLLIAFFLFTLAGVAAAGYVFVLRPLRSDGVSIPSPLTISQRDLPAAQAAIMDMFRLIGEAMPGNPEHVAAMRRLLIVAGYRWPSAVSVFVGIRGAFPQRSRSRG